MQNRISLVTGGQKYNAAGLLLLRVIVAGSLLLKHGLEKITTFPAMSQHFPDPIHIGVVPSLVIAMLADFVCSILIILGLATRWAALFSFMNVLVAWALVHHFSFFGKPQGDHGELIVVYLGVMLALSLTGGGRFSLDAMLNKSSYSDN